MIGKTISHYKILKKLGEGGMGVVYKAQDTKLQRTVAIKVLKPETMGDPAAKKRFIREARAASALNHPNITTIHEIDEWHGQDFICMEYVEGETVKKKIQSGQMPMDEVLNIAAQTAEALQEAHEHDIIHRDIKSENIMVTPKGQVKVMDFGLAKLKGKKTLTKAGVKMGTVSYMSPEQARGEDVDHRTDIWSFGVVLYEMITGQAPFRGDHELAVIYSILNEEPKPISDLRPDVSVELVPIVNKCLHKEASDRYQHVNALIEQFWRLSKGTKYEKIPSFRTVIKSSSKKRFRYFKMPAFILLIFAIITVGYLLLKQIGYEQKSETKLLADFEEKKSLAIMYFENNTGNENLDHWREGLSDLLIADLMQSKYLKVLNEHKLFNILSRLNLLEVKRYSSEILKLVATQANAGFLIVGNYTRAGEIFRINITLHHSESEEIISSQVVEGKGEESFFPMVDELTKRIKVDLALSDEQIADDIDQNVGKITTSSPEAFEYYIQAKRLNDLGDFRQSIRLIEKAIAIDSTFAMAYRLMASIYFNLGYGSQAHKCRQKAYELRDRVSERERYIIEAEGVSTIDERIAVYAKLLQLYPDDELGNMKLAGMYLNIEEWDKAISQVANFVQNKAESYYYYMYQAYAYMAKGSYDKATEVLEYFLKNISDNWTIRLFLAGNYLCQREYDLAMAETDEVLSIAPGLFYTIYTKGDIYLCQGDLIHAGEQYRLLLESDDKTSQRWGGRRLGMLYLLQGKFKDSKNQYEQGIELAKKIGELGWEYSFHYYLAYLYLKTGNFEQALNECGKAGNDLYYKALVFIEMGKIDSAQNAANKLKVEIENSPSKKQLRYYHQLLGRIELKQENWQEAIKNFQAALSLLSSEYMDIGLFHGLCDHALFFGPLALAYYQAGNLEKACERYEKITMLTYGRIGYGDIYAHSFYMLGKIYEEIGWKGKAIDYYSKYIELWQDCDPQFQPVVAEVREIIKKLKGE